MKSLLLFTLACAALAFAGNGPSLNLDRDLRLATQTKGQPVKATIAIRNSGDSLLKIDQIETPCGCTSTKLDRGQLAPGESGTLEVAIDTTRLAGTYDKTLVIHSNDPTAPTQNLRIRFDLAEGKTP
jgi:Protein of unknown function (DUF1573)